MAQLHLNGRSADLNASSNTSGSEHSSLIEHVHTTGAQQALNSLLNTGSSGTPSSWHQHTSNWHYQDQAVTASTLQVDNLQTHVHLTHHDFLVM